MPIYLKGQVELFGRIVKLSEATKKLVAEAVKETATRIAIRSRQKVPVHTGALSRSITTDLISYKGGALLTARIKALPWHAFPTEFGYKGRAGKGNRRHKLPLVFVGGKFKVVPALERWAQSKGIPPFLVARSLLQKGRKPRPFFFKSMEEERVAFVEKIKNIVAREAVAAIGKQADIRKVS